MKSRKFYDIIIKLETTGYEIDLFDGNMFLNLLISNRYFPNEQKTKEYFTIAIYNIKLPWILDEPYPEIPKPTQSIFTKIKRIFKI